MLRTTPAQVAEKARQRAALRAQEAEGQPESPGGGCLRRVRRKALPGGAVRRLTSPWMVSMEPIPESSPLHSEKKPFFSRRRTPTPDEVLQPAKDAPVETAEPPG